MNDVPITRWLENLAEGKPGALDELMHHLYADLRAMAREKLRHEASGHTLGATALVNESYLRLAQNARISAESRTRFFAVAAQTMRRVLVDYARAKKRLKRGGGEAPIPLEEVEAFLSAEEADEILALDRALDRLAQLDARAAQVVEQRFYAGLSVEEVAQALGVTPRTVHRDWVAARAWLRKEVGRELEL